MAEYVGREGIAPELVLCSPSRRTRDTLARIARELGEAAEVRIEPAIYAASAANLLELLRDVPDPVRSVMMIGHNPGIQDLAVSIARGGPAAARAGSKFPTAALATLALDGSWWELAPGTAELMAFVKPKDLL
jgi:phosphohistidine phosphatase